MKIKGIRWKTTRASFYEHFFVLFLILFGIWTILSGKLDAKHLTIGLVTSLVVTLLTLKLLQLPGARDNQKYYMAFDFPVFNFLLYFVWLFWEIVKANIDVALIVLNPKLPIDPQMVTFKKAMDNPLAHVTLANSITLTPGTVTVDVIDDLYVVHAITRGGALSLAPQEGEGEMPIKVARLFGEEDKQ